MGHTCDVILSGKPNLFVCVCVCVMNLRRNDFINFVLQRRREDQKIGCRDGEGWLSFHGRIMHIIVVFFTFCKYPLLGIVPLLWQRTLRGYSSYFKKTFDGLFQVRLGYIGLGDCSIWLGNWPRRIRAHLKERCHERDFTPSFFSYLLTD